MPVVFLSGVGCSFDNFFIKGKFAIIFPLTILVVLLLYSYQGCGLQFRQLLFIKGNFVVQHLVFLSGV